MFAHRLGVSKDPTTGSAAEPIGVYVKENVVLKNHELGAEILIEQCPK